MKQASIQVDDETARRMAQLAGWWGLPETRHNTPVVQQAVAIALQIEAARRSLSDADFVGFLAELHQAS